MNEEKNKAIAKLEEEFWRRVDALPKSDNHNRLDAGRSRVSEIYDWFKDECVKIKEIYGDG